MNDYYYYNKRLNFKKVIIAILIIIALIWAAILILLDKQNDQKEKPQEVISNSTNEVIAEDTIIPSKESSNSSNIIYEDINKTISIELKKSYNLESYVPRDNRLLVLKSTDNLSVYISKSDLVPNRDLLSIVNADKSSFVEKVGPYSNLTEITELRVGSLQAFTYGLHYLETTSNSAYLLQIVWLEAPDGYYMFDVEYPLNDNIYYQNVLTEILSTFTINSFIGQNMQPTEPVQN